MLNLNESKGAFQMFVWCFLFGARWLMMMIIMILVDSYTIEKVSDYTSRINLAEYNMRASEENARGYRIRARAFHGNPKNGNAAARVCR